MPSNFVAPAANAYDAMMGRWSRRLTPQLLDFAGLGNGERIIDIGCGTGSLTFSVLERASVERIDAIDFNAGFVEALRHRNTRLMDANSLLNARSESSIRLISRRYIHEFPLAHEWSERARGPQAGFACMTAMVGGKQQLRQYLRAPRVSRGAGEYSVALHSAASFANCGTSGDIGRLVRSALAGNSAVLGGVAIAAFALRGRRATDEVVVTIQ